MSNFLSQGYKSHSQQLGDAADMLSGTPTDIPSRGLEAFLPKSFYCSKPGSSVIRHHGKSNHPILQNWRFPVRMPCKTKLAFSHSRPPTTATHPCHKLSRLLERWELPASTRHSCRMIPLSAAGSRHFVRFWPLRRPTFCSALAPRTSAAKRTRLCKQIRDILLHWKQDCRGTCIFLAV